MALLCAGELYHACFTKENTEVQSEEVIIVQGLLVSPGTKL